MIELLNIDCMEYMATLPDKAFDLAVVDPPYGIGATKFFMAGVRNDQRNGRPIICRRNKRGDWDNKRPDNNYFSELIRISKNQIIFGGNYFADLLPPKSCWLVWDKVNGKMDQSDCELAWTSFNTAVRQLRYMWHIAQGVSIERGDVAQGNNKLWERRIHPTQKPVALYKWLFQNYAKPGQRILDTHLGSGSSAIAAHYFGCDFVGCEIDESYFLAAKERFERETKQITLFGAEGDQPQCDKADKDTGDYQNDLRF